MGKTAKNKHNKTNFGFTIVELLVVIVVIGVLAAITIVSYIGMTAKANGATIQSDLVSNKNNLAMYYTQYGEYPHINSLTGCPEAPSTVDSNYCLKLSSGNSFTYALDADPNIGFNLTITKGTVSYKVTKSTSPTIASVVSITCPIGFIVVPGSSTYGTSDFCVMKYEAKVDDNGDGKGDTNQTTGLNTWPADTYPISASRKLVSAPEGYPVTKISKTTAITAASTYTTGCASGCHLVTEAEWMTIAQNVLSVASNWSDGAVGSGYIYSGHNDNAPNTAIVADASDTNGYANTGQTSGNQRRTLTLTNGEVIWDMAGNVYEWTAGQTTGGQPGVVGNSYTSWIQWPSVTTPGSLTVNPFPSGTGIAGASSWASTQGIGQLFSKTDEVVLRGFIRGGFWHNDVNAGVLSLFLNLPPTFKDASVGFRASWI